MKRVLILGSGGSGKTTLALALAGRTGLPAIHLDKFYWRAGWTEPSDEEWQSQVAELCSRPAWIMDGNHRSTLAVRLAAADTLILLDVPRWLCLWRFLTRSLARLALPKDAARPDRPDGCTEQVDFGFIRVIAGFRRTHRPLMLSAFDEFAGAKAMLRNPAEVRAYLGSFK
jgi:hypothetical protein